MATNLSQKDQIVQALIANVTKRTPSNIQNEGGFDFTIGSPNRALMEGFSIQSDSIIKDINAIFDRERLNAMKVLAGADNNPATKANGKMDITATIDYTLLAETAVFSTAQGKAVASVISDVIFDGDPTLELKYVLIIANDSGSDVSFPAGDLYLSIAGLTGTNNATIANGKDAESDYELVQRIDLALLERKEATIAAITVKTLLVKLYDGSGNITEEVLDVLMLFPWQTDPSPQLSDVGDIDLYILSSIGTASGELLAAVNLALLGSTVDEGVQAAGMDINTFDSPKQDIAFTVVGVVVKAGYVFAAVEINIKAAINEYVLSISMGKPINPTSWQIAAGSAEGVESLDESSLIPATEQTLYAFETWNVTTITVTEAP